MADKAKKIFKKAVNGDAAALKKLSSLAEDGDVQAMIQLGHLYDEEGPSWIETDMAAARSWYKQAADAGYAIGQMSYGNMCHYGQGGDVDLNTAFKWYLAAAEQGEPESQMHVGRFYQTGRTVDPDIDAAKFWYERAVENGHELAATNLGMILYEDEKKEYEREKAFKLFSFAADKGDGLAHLYLGEMFLKGHGVALHGGKALLHYSIAEALMPEGQNRALATERKEWCLSKYPDLHDEFVERTNTYLAGKGYSRFQ